MADTDVFALPLARFVMSPHATLRWRQGKIMLASGTKPRTLTIEAAALSLLDLLSTPKSFEDIRVAELPVEANERQPLLRLLHEVGVVEALLPPASNDTEVWWDPNDRARYEASILTLIQIAHGFSASARKGLCVDNWGRPIPWLARPALEFLHQLDLSGVDVFEYGGGASTWYWARCCRSVTCVESNEVWCERLRSDLGTSATVLLRKDPREFVDAIMENDRLYNVILIDAAPALRTNCVGSALKRLARGGMILLDDAPFYPEAASELRTAGLIEVDFTGYAPLEDNFQTTSVFLSRDFDMHRRSGNSPVFPFGSPFFRWETFRPEEDR